MFMYSNFFLITITSIVWSTLHEQLPTENKWRYQIPWHPNGVSPHTTRTHQTYLDRLSKQFFSVITERLEEVLETNATLPELQSPLFREVVQHVHFCHQR